MKVGPMEHSSSYLEEPRVAPLILVHTTTSCLDCVCRKALEIMEWSERDYDKDKKDDDCERILYTCALIIC